MSRALAGSFVLLWVNAFVCAADAPRAEIVSVRRIWDQSPHNAFTDLARYNDRWYCVFREGKGHVSADGSIRVLTSIDGESWQSAALVQSPEGDLRDPKLSITPDRRLMLSAAEAQRDGASTHHQTFAWFSTDGKRWDERTEIGERDFWLWRTTWHKGTAYTVGYGCRPDIPWARLYKSGDGKQFDTIKSKLNDEGEPNESSLLFDVDDRCYCLLRRDGKPNSGLLGISEPPYTDWRWKDLGQRIGGPHMIRLPEGRFVAAVRLVDQPVRTALCWLDPEAGILTEFLKLPSGGDTSYAGLVWHDRLLWVSYYSSHEGKTSIYLAKVSLQ